MVDADDQVIDAAMARAPHQDACRDHALVAWVVWQYHSAYPHRFIAQLVTTSPLPYLVVGNTLAEVRAQLPPGLVRQKSATRTCAGGGRTVVCVVAHVWSAFSGSCAAV